MATDRLGERVDANDAALDVALEVRNADILDKLGIAVLLGRSWVVFDAGAGRLGAVGPKVERVVRVVLDDDNVKLAGELVDGLAAVVAEGRAARVLAWKADGDRFSPYFLQLERRLTHRSGWYRGPSAASSRRGPKDPS